LPAAAAVASEDRKLTAWLQAEVASPTFRVYANDDLIGVELCGAVKNVIALAAARWTGWDWATTPRRR